MTLYGEHVAHEIDNPTNECEIRPRLIKSEDRRLVKAKYTMSSMLVVAVASALKNSSFEGGVVSFGGFSRNIELEEDEEIKELPGDIPKDVADKNFREMARATAQKWYVALSNMFRSMGEVTKIPLWSSDGRMKIAIPGGHLGFEVGGILRFLNEQGLPADIDVIDTAETGQEKESMELDPLLSAKGSTVDFWPHTDATDFLRGKDYDLVVLRHPGPVNEMILIDKWREILKKTIETNPEMIIFSTYDHVIEDPEVIDHFKADRELRESNIFALLLKDLGYEDCLPDAGAEISDALHYPLSVYMTACETDPDRPTKLRWTLPVDRYMTIFRRRSDS
ncbi:hypothetical protein A2572_04985 [Candidatus Collierbacteria bacterium RIFOXYD1_FULL_40_9]|uniref:Uncharacterized protein n=1 Tax=Candidatus Collierbacteria bacterium RIFOXYD1_FULL_40_9 TaxID=1817731 RepID=A0A1F5FTZ4_9BACT|nr:MAG: hypothetical protein A2572_04985 [Candidatus Collierbacteria bacterium RIFOXYD1_FULL_40_9]